MHEKFVAIVAKSDTTEKLSFVSLKCAAENLAWIT